MEISAELPPNEHPLLRFISPAIELENLEYHAILKSQLANRYFQYVDEKFGKWNAISPERRMSFENILWVRPDEIFSGKYFFMAGPIKSNHIFQYQYSDLHWISCVCVLADTKDLIQRLFLRGEISREGIYCVFLHKNGAWKNLIIDDLFPINLEK